MTDAVIISLIGAVASFATTGLTLYVANVQSKNATKAEIAAKVTQTHVEATKAAVETTKATVEKLERNTNGIQEALTEATKLKAFGEGLAVGKDTAKGDKGDPGPKGEPGPVATVRILKDRL